MKLSAIIRYLIAGVLTRDYVILPNHSVLEDIPGGDALYTAIGLCLWDDQVALISRVSQDYPQAWIDELSNHGVSISGVQRAKEEFDQRSFIAYPEINIKRTTSPTSHYARVNRQFPGTLLGYTNRKPAYERLSKRPLSQIHLKDIPQSYFDASNAHICPMNIEMQRQLIYMMKQENISRISLRPHKSYMTPSHWNETHALFKNISTLIISEEKLRNLFHNRIDNLLDIVNHLGENGSEIIVVLRKNKNQLVYDKILGKIWEIPQYPFTRPVNPTGSRAAFAGGFLSGYRQTYNVLEAALMGNISASIVMEVKKPFDAFNFLPALKNERLHVLRGLSKEL